MIKSVKEKIGKMRCRGLDETGQDCTYDVPVWRDSQTGSLSYTCQECRCGSYAKNDGSPNYKGVLARINQSAPVPPVEPVPVKKPSTLFG